MVVLSFKKCPRLTAGPKILAPTWKTLAFSLLPSLEVRDNHDVSLRCDDPNRLARAAVHGARIITAQVYIVIISHAPCSVSVGAMPAPRRPRAGARGVRARCSHHTDPRSAPRAPGGGHLAPQAIGTSVMYLWLLRSVGPDALIWMFIFQSRPDFSCLQGRPGFAGAASVICSTDIRLVFLAARRPGAAAELCQRRPLDTHTYTLCAHICVGVGVGGCGCAEREREGEGQRRREGGREGGREGERAYDSTCNMFSGCTPKFRGLVVTRPALEHGDFVFAHFVGDDSLGRAFAAVAAA